MVRKETENVATQIDENASARTAPLPVALSRRTNVRRFPEVPGTLPGEVPAGPSKIVTACGTQACGARCSLAAPHRRVWSDRRRRYAARSAYGHRWPNHS